MVCTCPPSFNFGTWHLPPPPPLEQNKPWKGFPQCNDIIQNFAVNLCWCVLVSGRASTCCWGVGSISILPHKVVKRTFVMSWWSDGVLAHPNSNKMSRSIHITEYSWIMVLAPPSQTAMVDWSIYPPLLEHNFSSRPAERTEGDRSSLPYKVDYHLRTSWQCGR